MTHDRGTANGLEPADDGGTASGRESVAELATGDDRHTANDPAPAGLERTVSWRELLWETESLVGDRVHARWICETATASTPDEFRSMLTEPANARAVAHLDGMVARRRAGEPIQYVLGSWGFRRLDLAIDPRVLIPRPETELIVELALDRARTMTPRRLADLGTGSGAIGLALADELPLHGTTVWLTDVSDDSLDVARANLAGLGRAAANVRIGAGWWFDALPGGEKFDVIVSNPPYVAVGSPDLDPDVAGWEPAGALLAGDDGLDALRTVVAGAPPRLAPGGSLLVEHGHDQAAAVRDLFAAAGFAAVVTSRDPAGHERVTAGRLP